MFEGHVGRDSLGRVPLQTSLDKIQEKGVVAAFQGGLQGLGPRGPTRFSSSAVAPLQDGGPVGQGSRDAVAGVALAGDEVLGPLALLQQLVWGHALELHDASQLVCFVLQSKNTIRKERQLKNIVNDICTSVK